MSTKVKEGNNKKRKYSDDSPLSSHSPKKQQQSILQYCFSKSTTAIKAVLTGQNDNEAAQEQHGSCPVCNMTLEELSIIQVQSHVNSCLDNSSVAADIDNSTTTADTTNTNTVKANNSSNSTTNLIIETNEVETLTTSTPDNTIECDSTVTKSDTDKVMPSSATVKSDTTTATTNAESIITTPNNNCATTPLKNNDSNSNSKSSWAKLFSEATFQIRGIWSSRKGDHAPGLTESEISWFGEPKSATATPSSDTTTAVKKKRPLPYYKRLAGTKMVVDTFSFGEIPDCEGYLLSHFHSDHYMGLNGTWIHGPIYCSEITARLVESKLGVSQDFIHPLPMDTPCLLSGTDGLTVTLIDANHCPGAVIFLITVPQQDKVLRYLHTGDFRACPKMCLHPMLKQPENPPLDILYLDTTYLDPKYSFPSQVSCIKSACDLAKHHNNYLTTGVITDADLAEKNLKIDHWFAQEKISNRYANNDDNGSSRSSSSKKQERLLVVVGTYSLGKERIFIEVAKCLNSKIYVADQKRAMLEALHDEELNQALTNEPQDAQVHVIPLWHVLPENLEAYYHSLETHFTQMIAFRPTGWTFCSSSDPQQPKNLRSLESIIKARPPDLTAAALKPTFESPNITIYGVPYSEHSSYRELALFIASLDIRRIVPTVNVYNEKSRVKMSSLFEKWGEDKKKLVAQNGGVTSVIKYPTESHW